MPRTPLLRAETRHMSICRPFTSIDNTCQIYRSARICRSARGYSVDDKRLHATFRPSRTTFPTLSHLNTADPIASPMAAKHTRNHAGHPHGGHSHSHDNTYLTSQNKNDAGVRITRIGLFVNLGMAVGKGVGGVLFNSQALIADGFHALTDLISDFMTLATISWSLKPATDRFPNGYGKIEGLGALGVSSLLLFGGIGIGLNGLDALYSQFVLDAAAHAQEHAEHGHGLFSFLGHSHSHGSALPDLNAAWLAAGSIVVKEWLYRASKLSTNNRVRRVVTDASCSHENCSRTQVLRACV